MDSALSNGLINVYINVEDYEQFVYSLNGGNAEQRAGGVQIQAIPKSGGNEFAGRAFALGSNSALSAKNASDEQLAAGLRLPTELLSDSRPAARHHAGPAGSVPAAVRVVIERA